MLIQGLASLYMKCSLTFFHLYITPKMIIFKICYQTLYSGYSKEMSQSEMREERDYVRKKLLPSTL